MSTDWNLGTASYKRFKEGWGVACGTSVGRNRRFPSHQVEALKPFTTFRKAEHLPVPQQEAMYRDLLDTTREYVELRLSDLTRRYPDERLVLLCWCDLSLPGAYCHRRWAAGWFADTYGLVVPELTDELWAAQRRAERAAKVTAVEDQPPLF